MSNLIHTEKYKGFDINFFAEPEYLTFDQMGFDEIDIESIEAKLENYELICFCAKVTASKNEIELACEYLGGCIYETEMDFVKQDDYYSDMKETVVNNAIRSINDLKNDLPF